jgi:hypothetical protein
MDAIQGFSALLAGRSAGPASRQSPVAGVDGDERAGHTRSPRDSLPAFTKASNEKASNRHDRGLQREAGVVSRWVKAGTAADSPDCHRQFI